MNQARRSITALLGLVLAPHLHAHSSDDRRIVNSVRLDQRSPSLGLFLLALALGAFLSPPAILAADYENGLAPPGARGRAQDGHVPDEL
jgi:hypothetical protein